MYQSGNKHENNENWVTTKTCLIFQRKKLLKSGMVAIYFYACILHSSDKLTVSMLRDVPRDTFLNIDICYERKLRRYLVWLYTIILNATVIFRIHKRILCNGSKVSLTTWINVERHLVMKWNGIIWCE